VITPFGPDILLLPLTMNFGKLAGTGFEEVFAATTEFKPLTAVFVSEYVLLLKGLFVLAGASLLVNVRRLSPWTAGTFVTGVVLSFVYMRLMGFGAVVGAYALLDNLPGAWEQLRAFRPSLAAAAKKAAPVAALGVAVWIASLSADAVTGDLGIRTGDMRAFGEMRFNLAHPWKAAAFVAEHDLEGNCFCNYDIGSFLILALPERNRVLIDTQLLYTYEYYFRYDRIMKGREPLQPLLDRYGAGFVLLKHESGDVVRMLRALLADPDWRLVYLDECAAIFLPVKGENGDRAAALRVDLDDGDPKRHLSDDAKTDARAFTTLGDFFAKVGRPGRAKGLYLEAVEKRPGLFTAWNNLGVILMNEGHAREAMHCFTESVRRNRRYEKPRKNLRTLLERGALDPADPEVKKARALVD
jgi:tetratricopeptide (TPR) repeat protein